MFVSWAAGPDRGTKAADEFTTALSILAYTLGNVDVGIPPEILRSAETLYSRLDGAPPTNVGLLKFYLAAIRQRSRPNTSQAGLPAVSRSPTSRCTRARYSAFLGLPIPGR